MAFQSGSSAFGLKPATTANTNTGGPSIFSSSIGGQKPAQTGSIFGQPQQGQQQAAVGGGVFGGSSAFGQTQQQSQQPQQGNSLFGGSAFGQPQQQQGTQQQPTQGSLFGGNTLAQPQPQSQSSTSLFGQPQQQTQQPTTSLFGQPAQNQQSQPQQNAFGGSSLFGGSTTQNQNQPGQSTSGFGNWGNTSTNTGGANTGGSIFGGANTGGSTLFGAPKPTGFLGQPAQQQQQPQILFGRSTKFNDLPEEIKKQLESLDSHIQGRVQISNSLKQKNLGDDATKGQLAIRAVHKDLVAVASNTRSALAHSRALRDQAEHSARDVLSVTRIIDAAKMPSGAGHATLKAESGFPFELFSRVTMQMRDRLEWCQRTIEQIERKVTTSSSQAHFTPQAISTTLQAQHATAVALAARTAAIDGKLDRIRAQYTQLWRARTGSARDPFAEAERPSDGMEGLRI